MLIFMFLQFFPHGHHDNQVWGPHRLHGGNHAIKILLLRQGVLTVPAGHHQQPGADQAVGVADHAHLEMQETEEDQ